MLHIITFKESYKTIAFPYSNRSRERMDHDRMDPRDRGMSGAEGPPPPPRTTNHRQSDNSRDRRGGKLHST